jgi:3-isopropylmalate/(R)-2-methylmalate dehydratase large subunit
MAADCLFEKIWNLHIVEQLDGEDYLLAVDRCFLHDLSGPGALRSLVQNGLAPYDKNRVIAVPDHTVSAKPCRTEEDSPISRQLLPPFRAMCAKYGITLFDLTSEYQGIVHVIGPELGLSLPGMTIVCGDSHTCTHGALGALAWGIGTSELYHVLATQTVVLSKPKTMRVAIEGKPAGGTGPMDIILHVISKLGTDFANGYAVEYTGEVIRGFGMEDRMTICNLSVEFGSEYGLISPDEKTIAYIKDRPCSPTGAMLVSLAAHCREIASTCDSVYDRDITIDVTGIERQVSWGITPAQTIGINEHIPAENLAESPKGKMSFSQAYDYMAVRPGAKVAGLKVDKVFIGACANGRLSNIREVAALVEGKKVAPGVDAWVVPGSQQVKKETEKLGLDKIIKEAGFVWGEPACSLCGGSNGEKLQSGQRSVSTTNRNFIGRQGPGARTHLASPRTAALSALSGVIC